MREVLFVRAAESSDIPEDIRRLRRDIAGHIEISRLAERTNGDGPPAAHVHSTLRDLKADLVVVCVTNGKPSPEPAVADPPVATHDADYPTLSREQRALIPDTIQVVTARGLGVAHAEMPEDLRPYRSFDVSSTDGFDAMRCRAVHGELGPVRPIRGDTHDLANAILRVLTGVTATVIGNLDRTQDFLVGTLGGYVLYVHYFMALIVVALILSGAFALLVPLLDPLLTRLQPGHTGSKRGWRLLALAAAAAFTALIAATFPATPSVGARVDKHVREWSQRLVESQMGDGGIREHHDSGRTQAWITAQALSAQLRHNVAAMSAADYQRAERFLRRTQIVNAPMTDAVSSELQNTAVSLGGSPVGPRQLPQTLPSIAFAYDTVAMLVRRPELPQHVVSDLDTKSASLFPSGASDEGWGYFAQFDWGVTEIAAWVAVGLADYQRASIPGVQRTVAEREATAALLRSIEVILRKRQLTDGGFSPIEDTSQLEFGRTYSTVMAIWALSELSDPSLKLFDQVRQAEIDQAIREGVKWLGRHVQTRGWQVSPSSPTNEPPFLGLAAQTLCVLDQVRIPIDSTSSHAFEGVRSQILNASPVWLNRDLGQNDRIHDADRYLFPTMKVTEGSTFLWYPWTLAYLKVVASDPRKEHAAEAAQAAELREKLLAKVGEFDRFVGSAYNYVAAEALIGLHWRVRPAAAAR